MARFICIDGLGTVRLCLHTPYAEVGLGKLALELLLESTGKIAACINCAPHARFVDHMHPCVGDHPNCILSEVELRNHRIHICCIVTGAAPIELMTNNVRRTECRALHHAVGKTLSAKLKGSAGYLSCARINHRERGTLLQYHGRLAANLHDGALAQWNAAAARRCSCQAYTGPVTSMTIEPRRLIINAEFELISVPTVMA